MLLTGAKLFLLLANMFCVLGRWTVENPAISPPDDERSNMGCEGRPGASDMRDPDVERAWFVVVLLLLLLFPNREDEVRFMAEAGMGMADTLCDTAPSVC